VGSGSARQRAGRHLAGAIVSLFWGTFGCLSRVLLLDRFEMLWSGCSGSPH